MKTNELIRILSEIDPVGNLDVCINENPIILARKNEPGYDISKIPTENNRLLISEEKPHIVLEHFTNRNLINNYYPSFEIEIKGAKRINFLELCSSITGNNIEQLEKILGKSKSSLSKAKLLKTTPENDRKYDFKTVFTEITPDPYKAVTTAYYNTEIFPLR